MDTSARTTVDRSLAQLALLGFLVAIAVGGCDGSDDRSRAPVAPASQEELAAPGPFGVASFDLTFVDRSRATRANGAFLGAPERTLPVRIWYPVDPADSGRTGAPPAPDGPFPLIGYAHGFTSGRGEAARLGEHLVSHGYIVIAPDFPLSNGGAPGGPSAGDIGNQPADLAFVMQELPRAAHPVASAIDLERQGIAGLSLGGGTVVIGAFHPTQSLKFVRAAVALAPAACFTGPDFYGHSVPTMLIAGTADELVPFEESPQRAYDWAPPPVTLVRLEGATHIGMLGIDVPGSRNSDIEIACAAVGGEVDDEDESSFAETVAILTAGLEGDVYRPDGCNQELFCKHGYVQTMRAERQLEIVRVATLAHFEANLRGRADAAAFVERSLGAQNSDVGVSVK